MNSVGSKSSPGNWDSLVLDELGNVPAGKLRAELLFDVISSGYALEHLGVCYS